MTLRSATVLGVGRVSIPNSGEEAWQVETDLPVAVERAFYLRLDDPCPPRGAEVNYGDHHATWTESGREQEARKVGYNFDPDAVLR